MKKVLNYLYATCISISLSPHSHVFVNASLFGSRQEPFTFTLPRGKTTVANIERKLQEKVSADFRAEQPIAIRNLYLEFREVDGQRTVCDVDYEIREPQPDDLAKYDDIFFGANPLCIIGDGVKIVFTEGAAVSQYGPYLAGESVNDFLSQILQVIPGARFSVVFSDGGSMSFTASPGIIATDAWNGFFSHILSQVDSRVKFEKYFRILSESLKDKITPVQD